MSPPFGLAESRAAFDFSIRRPAARRTFHMRSPGRGGHPGYRVAHETAACTRVLLLALVSANAQQVQTGDRSGAYPILGGRRTVDWVRISNHSGPNWCLESGRRGFGSRSWRRMEVLCACGAICPLRENSLFYLRTSLPALKPRSILRTSPSPAAIDLLPPCTSRELARDSRALSAI